MRDSKTPIGKSLKTVFCYMLAVVCSALALNLLALLFAQQLLCPQFRMGPKKGRGQRNPGKRQGRHGHASGYGNTDGDDPSIFWDKMGHKSRKHKIQQPFCCDVGRGQVIVCAEADINAEWLELLEGESRATDGTQQPGVIISCINEIGRNVTDAIRHRRKKGSL